jgi:hypothetical protein
VVVREETGCRLLVHAPCEARDATEKDSFPDHRERGASIFSKEGQCGRATPLIGARSADVVSLVDNPGCGNGRSFGAAGLLRLRRIVYTASTSTARTPINFRSLNCASGERSKHPRPRALPGYRAEESENSSPQYELVQHPEVICGLAIRRVGITDRSHESNPSKPYRPDSPTSFGLWSAALSLHARSRHIRR